MLLVAPKELRTSELSVFFNSFLSSSLIKRGEALPLEDRDCPFSQATGDSEILKVKTYQESEAGA